MKHKGILACFVALLLVGCAEEQNVYEQDRLSVGIMLSDNGLGDQSFSDTGFQGAMKARDELGIVFDYNKVGYIGYANLRSKKPQFIEKTVADFCSFCVSLGGRMK